MYVRGMRRPWDTEGRDQNHMATRIPGATPQMLALQGYIISSRAIIVKSEDTCPPLSVCVQEAAVLGTSASPYSSLSLWPGLFASLLDGSLVE